MSLLMSPCRFILMAPAAAAVEIDSSTTQFLSFRDCVAGESPCDRFDPLKTWEVDGLPGSRLAEASRDEPGYGIASGSTRLSDDGIGSEHHARSSSKPGTRVGSNGFMLQKYTNSTDQSQTLVFIGMLSFKYVIPEADADLPADSLGRSGAFAELGAYRVSTEMIEAGTTANENFDLLLEGPPDELEFNNLGHNGSEMKNNRSGEGSEEITFTVTAAPGESTWFWAGLQSLTANGAEVSAKLTTGLQVSVAE